MRCLSIAALLSLSLACTETEEGAATPDIGAAEDEVEDVDLSKVDTDNDGFSDQEELDANTAPDDASDFPYTGEYAIDSCRWDVDSTGNGVGDTAENFKRKDQHGDGVRLHDFCGQTVLLISSAMWCGPCNTEAKDVARWYNTLKEDGLMVITLLGEDVQGNTPDQADLESWANMHGITHAVVADRDWNLSYRYVSGSLLLPTMHVIGPGGEVVALDGRFSRQRIVQFLEQD